MSKPFRLFLLTAVCFAFSLSAMEGRLMKQPDIGNGKIVFTLEDDLWIVSDTGGTASRITTHPGVENHAKFSPDGKWVAFTAGYDGGRDVYVMPSEGGVPKRLTYHPKPDDVVEWLPGGKSILFRSNRTVSRKAFIVPVSGGPDYPFPADDIRYASFSPDGKKLALNRNDSDRMNWNGYKGGDQQDIWVEDLTTAGLTDKNPSSIRFEKITDYPGYDNHPMWHGGIVFFASDRDDGRMNLYAYNLKDKSVQRKTFFKDWDVESPSIGLDKIVFVRQGRLWVYDIPSNAAESIRVEIPSDRWLTRKSFVDPSEFIQEITLSRDGKTAAVQSRGEVYLLSEKDPVQLTRSYSNEIFPAISPDGKWVAFFSDRSGEHALYLSPPKQSGDWIKLTGDLESMPYHPLWSPDSKKLLFGDKDYRLYWLDVGQKKLIEIDRSRFQRDNEIYWEVSEYDWSPDSKWVVYAKCEANMNNAVYLYSLETRKAICLTDDRYDNTSPAFDRNGKFIYFLSLRNFDPLLDPFMDNHINGNMSKILAVQLRAGERIPFEKNDGSDGVDTRPEKTDSILTIDMKGISERIYSVPFPAGTFSSLKGARDGFFYLSREQFGFPDRDFFLHPKFNAAFTLHHYNTANLRDTELISGIGCYNVSEDGSKAAYLSGAFSGVIDTFGESIKGDGALNWGGYKQEVDFVREYQEILLDAWRLVRDFFYDPDMHGKDWTAVRKKYEPLIPFAASRSDLNDLIGKMIGELGVSHEYILDDGDLSRKPADAKIGVGLLGADMVPDAKNGCWRFQRIIHGAGWNPRLQNPLEAPDIRIQPGDCLLAIDGETVRADENYLDKLAGKAGKPVNLTVSPKPDITGARIVSIQTLRDETAIRHFEWKEQNYEKVKTLSRGRIGYMHLSDMDETGIREFEQGFRAERFRDGLVIDVRNNRGGFVSWFLIDKLERKLALFTQTRDFKPMRYPHGVHPGPLVFLCNEGTSSDGEVFIQHVQSLGLGPVVGSDTWGGLLGFNNIIPLLDGGIVTQSNIGFFDAEPPHGWIVENRGAKPDIPVQNTPEDVLAERDPQLEKAVEVCLQRIENKNAGLLDPPDFSRK